MSLFYAISGGLALVTLALIVWPLFRRGAGAESRDAKDVRLYRDQLAEVERDLARGVIRAGEAEGARAEISRRLIAAAGRAEAGDGPGGAAPGTATGLTAGLALIAVPLIAGMVYLAEGSPGTPDVPFAARGLDPTIDTATRGGPQRPSQRNAEAMLAEARAGEPEPALTPEQAEFSDLVERIAATLEERGPDARGLTLLANGLSRLGRHAEAWRAYAQLIEVEGDAAGASLLGLQAEAMVLATDGYVSPEAEAVIKKALAKDPEEVLARYYHGLALLQSGDRDGGLAVWQGLRDEAPAGSPWAEALDQMIAGIGAGGTRTPVPGPSEEDMEAAADMSPEERMAMIEGMVARLEERLTTEGGEAEEWLRLMTAYRQLGRMDDARRIYQMGRMALAADGSGADSFLRQQALVLGIIEQ